MLFRNLLIIFSIHKVFFIFSKWIVTQIFLEFNPFFFLAFNSLSSLSAYRRFDSNFNTYCSSTEAFFSNIVVPQIRSVVGDLILGWWLILKLGSIQLYRWNVLERHSCLVLVKFSKKPLVFSRLYASIWRPWRSCISLLKLISHIDASLGKVEVLHFFGHSKHLVWNRWRQMTGLVLTWHLMTLSYWWQEWLYLLATGRTSLLLLVFVFIQTKRHNSLPLWSWIQVFLALSSTWIKCISFIEHITLICFLKELCDWSLVSSLVVSHFLNYVIVI